jgi:hypothetical protein
MSSQPKQTEPPPVVEREDWPPDLSREIAAFRKVEGQLARDHLGWFALVYGGEVIGLFRTHDEAMYEGCRRFGPVAFLVTDIRDPNEPPEFIPWLYWTDETGKPRV